VRHVRYVTVFVSLTDGLRVRLVASVDERAQGPQPGFVASPARDGGAIDRLPGLPLAGGLHSPRIAFGAQASVVPRQAAGCDNPADDWFDRMSGTDGTFTRFVFRLNA